MKIGNFEIGSRPFIICEAGLNHNGSIERAMAMADEAHYAGCTAVKYQTFKADEFCAKDDSLYPWFKKSELKDSDWPKLKRHCDERGIMFLSTPQNRSDLDLLLPLGIPAIKVGSDDATNYELLADYAKEGLPMIISTGMCSEEDLWNISKKECPLERKIIYLVCTSQYPTLAEETNISRVKTFADAKFIVGFSDHTMGNTASIMAVALGATIFEKHFTLNKALPGPDHAWACNPAELKSWVDAINEAWIMKGTGSFELSEKEKEQKRKYQRRSGQRWRGK